jgi:hypothetical protein
MWKTETAGDIQHLGDRFTTPRYGKETPKRATSHCLPHNSSHNKTRRT